MEEKNLGRLERWLLIEWSLLKAHLYCWFHGNCSVYTENTWVEGKWNHGWHNYEYTEQITLVSIIEGSLIQFDKVRFLHIYYGNPRLVNCDNGDEHGA